MNMQNRDLLTTPLLDAPAPPSALELYDEATLLLAAARAMVAAMGCSASSDSGDGVCYEDAAWGINHLLDEAADAFRQFRQLHA